MAAMSASNPFDEFLNAEVDENTISALVGTLESQLSSPTTEKTSTARNASENHLNRSSAASAGLKSQQSPQQNDVASPKPTPVHGAPHHNSVIIRSKGSPGPPPSRVIHAGGNNAGLNSIGGGVVPAGSPAPLIHTNNDTSSSGVVNRGLPTNSVVVTQQQTVTAASNGSPAGAKTIVTSNAGTIPAGQISTNRTVLLKPGGNVNNNATSGGLVKPAGLNLDQNSTTAILNAVAPPVSKSQQQQHIVLKDSMKIKQELKPTPQTNVNYNVAANSTVRPGVVSYSVRTPTNQAHRFSVAGGTPLKTLAPRIAPGTPIRIGPPQTHMISPRPGSNANTITLPAGLQAPAGGMVVIKNEAGQIVTVLHNPVPGQSSSSTMPMTPGPATYKIQTALKPPGSQQNVHTIPSSTPQPIAARTPGPPGMQPHVGQPSVQSSHSYSAHHKPHVAEIENVKKCKNFLTTLIKLASSQPKQTVENVKNLIQGLIDGQVEPETFTTQLQIELKSNPQPYLVPFLKKSLPLLRSSLANGKMEIEGVRPPKYRSPMPKMTTTMGQIPTTLQTPRVLKPHHHHHSHTAAAAGLNKTLFKSPPPSSSSSSAAASRVKKYDPLKDDDDINDVAAMGGVNIIEESRNILSAGSDILTTQVRSCKDEYFLNHGPLLKRIMAAAQKHGITDVPPEVAHLVSHATQERLRNLLERLSVIAEHRLEIYKIDQRYEATSEVKSQLKFVDELDKLEKKRHEEHEREKLLRAAKSRSKHEDPEQLKLKQKAKEMQQMEMEETRQREANLTALAAIGPRKKRKIDTTGESSSSAVGSAFGSGTPGSSQRPMSLRPRIRRVNLRDLLFLMEQERESTKSNTLYKAFLK
ncbi:transcription initiation factor TFIID subunit 4B-like [Tubulanus polymorphus]|uniref:transcription initiation factor TFIID subunit 4B-like n=1 Tax=Tubulanus polymorphus TaxID=672921 RepID=UPI003DA377C0